jgi:hypothetical protein
MLMCGEAGCGEFFTSVKVFTAHWKALHRVGRCRCPVPIEIPDHTPVDVAKPVDTPVDVAKPVDTKQYLTSVCEYIMKKCECNRTEAVSRYKTFVRDPRLVRMGIIIHDNKQEPYITEANSFLLDSFLIHKGEKGESVVCESQGIMEDEYEHVDKRAKTTVVSQQTQDQFDVFMEKVDNIKFTLSNIDELVVDDNVKKALRHMMVDIVIGKQHCAEVKHPVVISSMVREHLGYLPAKVEASDLFKAIGRRARHGYRHRYNHDPPKMQVESSGGQLRSINEYSYQDKAWIRDLVSEVCDESGIHPRPLVAIARGEDIKN